LRIQLSSLIFKEVSLVNLKEKKKIASSTLLINKILITNRLTFPDKKIKLCNNVQVAPKKEKKKLYKRNKKN